MTSISERFLNPQKSDFQTTSIHSKINIPKNPEICMNLHGNPAYRSLQYNYMIVYCITSLSNTLFLNISKVYLWSKVCLWIKCVCILVSECIYSSILLPVISVSWTAALEGCQFHNDIHWACYITYCLLGG